MMTSEDVSVVLNTIQLRFSGSIGAKKEVLLQKHSV